MGVESEVLKVVMAMAVVEFWKTHNHQNGAPQNAAVMAIATMVDSRGIRRQETR
jgi:hypothetical protein